MNNDWWCDNCNINIFGYKQKCLKCNKNRPEHNINKVYNVKGGDWWCDNCNINIHRTVTDWSKWNGSENKSECKKCGKKAPPFSI